MSSFHEKKNNIVGALCKLFSRFQAKGMEVELIRIDNAPGEKKAFEKEAESSKELYPMFENTAVGTPQLNYLVEKGFHTMMIGANVNETMRFC